MVTYLLKKSYQRKDLKKVVFNDLWNSHGVFTTMWIFNNPHKILFFNKHINNLIQSLKDYDLYKNNIDKIYGFQFHPESFLTENGNLLIKKILSA